MSNDIVVVNVSQTSAPAPNTLQKTGALLTQGGTSTPAQTLTLVTSLAGVTAILEAPVALTSLTWSANVVTATTTAPHGWTNGDNVFAMITGATPSGYNRTHVMITITGVSTFTYPLTGNPGSETVPGFVTLYSESELLQMATTYFAQPNPQAVYVLELGEGNVTEGVAALTTFIGNNPNTIYSYLIPRSWDGNSVFINYAATLATPVSKTYFFTTASIGTETAYAGNKAIFAQVESPTTPATEFTLASDLAVTLGYSPNSTNRVTPISYSFVYGVTPYPLQGNGAILATLNADNVGYIDTGAEGGLSNFIIKYGQMQDGNPFNYWYAADWFQINAKLNLANEVINGSNNPLAPLHYDQNGINRLQARLIQTAQQGVTNGLLLGRVVAVNLPSAQFELNYQAGAYVGMIPINAEPFLIYSAENPSDYSIGKYAGLSAVVTPLRGFKQIFFNMNITNIIVP